MPRPSYSSRFYHPHIIVHKASHLVIRLWRRSISSHKTPNLYHFSRPLRYYSFFNNSTNKSCRFVSMRVLLLRLWFATEEIISWKTTSVGEKQS
jgi:hypothetical protein